VPPVRRGLRVIVDPTRYPDAVSGRLIDELRAGRLPADAHYGTERQARAWKAVQSAYSPFCTAAEGTRLYRDLSARIVPMLRPGPVNVLSLGCGAGEKDRLLLKGLAGRKTRYLPVDASLELLLSSALQAQPHLGSGECLPRIADLDALEDWSTLGAGLPAREQRVILFYGLLPNLDPRVVGSGLQALLRPADILLMSANLASGESYEAGVRAALPLYDNALTRGWLSMALEDLGFILPEGSWRVGIEPSPSLPGLLSVGFEFVPARSVALNVAGIQIDWPPGKALGVFRSHRYTVKQVQNLMRSYGLRVVYHKSSERLGEGVFLVRKPALKASGPAGRSRHSRPGCRPGRS